MRQRNRRALGRKALGRRSAGALGRGFVGMFLGICLATPTAFAAEAPAWFMDHLEFMAKDGGRWVTSNTAFQSEAEPFDTYAMDWQWGLGKKTLKGRMYALKDGKEVTTLWEFRTVWNPQLNKAYHYQFGGDGTLGIGVMNTTGEGRTASAQDFLLPDGGEFRAGHRNEHLKDGRFKTDSFDILPDGTWKARRSYTWKRRE
ncbi:MAG: hypothetical protein K0U98_25270 [Deltaproteobacteria bacterium]|nr:hypothetical protein [Deltaproteobacteria bacterium]